MYVQQVTVHYIDGGQKDVALDQWSVGQWAAYASKMGWRVTEEDPMLGVLMLRFQTYAEMHRDVSGARPAFDVWDRTVREVEPQDDDDPVDVPPTGATS